MSRFDVCGCGDSKKLVEQAELIVREIIKSSGYPETPCGPWIMAVANMADAMIQEIVGKCHGPVAQTRLWHNSIEMCEALRPHIEASGASLIAEFKSAPGT
jgi:hypothetical protein